MSEEQADITQQATAPTTAAPRVKNPKRVAAGKAIAEKTKQVREAQKKALAKAAAIIANDEAKKDTPEPAPEPAIPEPVNADQPPPRESVYWGFSTTQWLMVGGNVVSLLGLYYKREEIKTAHANLFNVGTTVDTPAPHVVTTVDTIAPIVAAKARRAPGIFNMD